MYRSRTCHCLMIVDCSRYVKVPDDRECDAMSTSSSQKSSDSSLNAGQSVDHLLSSDDFLCLGSSSASYAFATVQKQYRRHSVHP